MMKHANQDSRLVSVWCVSLALLPNTSIIATLMLVFCVDEMHHGSHEITPK